MPPRSIWTVGHSNFPFDTFAALLAEQRIEFVADVRSHPYSRFAPQFSREALQEGLCRQGIRYVFLGEELGGRPSADEHYDADGHALYRPMSQEPRFCDAIDRLVICAAHHRIAIVCSEADPDACHRRRLVGKVLTERGLELHHIHADGSVTVEREVGLDPTEQTALFEQGVAAWRSTQSVSHRRRLNISSTA